jgi:hypothetical protein
MQPEAVLRLATWNVEWFNALFDDEGRPLADGEPSARYRVTRGAQLAAIGIVLTALDADGVMVIEAPDTNGHRSAVRALERFAGTLGLRQARAVSGFVSDTEQEIAFLYDPARLAARHDPRGRPAFDGTWHVGDRAVRLSRPPLELAVSGRGGLDLRLIGVHAKSKAPHGAKDEAEARLIAVENRRKQIAECEWIRARVEETLLAGEDLIVMGDFNDGPGLDEYEAQFGRSGVEIVLGNGGPRLFDPHAAMALQRRVGIQPTTARFYLKPMRRYFEALLDFVMVSPGLHARRPDWRIWHPLNDPDIAANATLREALLTASDHFPVTLDLPLN